MSRNYTSLITLFLFLFLLLQIAFEQAVAGKSRVHIPDELDDVVDDEEDEAWKEWGRRKSEPDFDPPPDLTKLSKEQIQNEMIKRQLGPVFGFAKLRLGKHRTKEMVSRIALQWTRIARTGAIEAKFMGVDLGTVMVSMERGQDLRELKDFVLEQDEAYEVKIMDQIFRREGDPSLDEVMEKLRGKSDHDDQSSSKQEL